MFSHESFPPSRNELGRMFSLLNSAEATAPQKLEANAHLRFKRRGETLFISCNTKEPFGAIKQRLSQLVQRHHSEIQCYQYMTVQEKKEDMERRIEEKRRTAEEAVKKRLAAEAAAAAAAKKGKKGKKDKKKDKGGDAPVDEAPIKIEIKLEPEDTDPTYNPPIPDDRTMDNLRIPSDRIVMFIFGKNTEEEIVWEPINVPGCQEPENVAPQEEQEDVEEEKKGDGGEKKVEE